MSRCGKVQNYILIIISGLILGYVEYVILNVAGKYIRETGLTINFLVLFRIVVPKFCYRLSVRFHICTAFLFRL
jgi:hypothetical protein